MQNESMKVKSLFLLLAVSLLTTGCAGTAKGSSSGGSTPSGGGSSGGGGEGGGGSGGGGGTPSGPTKITVPAHTLSDSNPPVDVSGLGNSVNSSIWSKYQNRLSSAFDNNYNYTYRVWSTSGQQETTREQFTKNGYYVKSISGQLYYERKSGNTFYQYIKSGNEWLRQETTLDLKSKYTYRWEQECYVHMFNMSDYEYDEDLGMYIHIDYETGWMYQVEFHGNYITRLYYSLQGQNFEISASYSTTINIPKSYYYG